MKLCEWGVDQTLKLMDTVTFHMDEDKFGETQSYTVRIFADDKEKRWFAIRGAREIPTFCFESKLKADVMDQALRSLVFYEKYKKKPKRKA